MTQVNKITGATTNSVSAPNAEKVDKKVEVKLSSASQTDLPFRPGFPQRISRNIRIIFAGTLAIL